ncbi:ribonuclease Y [Egibacter rhizosphaerae]|uniref:Ribonuclease Y n=1 Tax=Egibacter rhizosphaerae TaxID=1670831 RepID=A0A411YJ75_9ACTN|nr:ribonuclease Y [Egibacter rhizosphaerae]QBI21280.1 ribonuclease Y [Egibacter rhizosphaerae]
MEATATAWALATVVALATAIVVLTVDRALARRRKAREHGGLDQREQRLLQREETLETKASTLELREANLLERERTLAAAQADLEDERVTVRKRLEELADYTADEARQDLIEEVEAQARADARELVRDVEQRTRQEAGRRGQEILATAVQRVASSSTAAVATSTVSLPDEDMKGRIIGRDGRNIRAFQQVTGVDVIVDDSPGVVTLSSFDGVRREIARRTLEALVEDGRIQPASIENAFEKAADDVQKFVLAAGEEAIREARVEDDVPDELVRLLGELEFRSSYGQNVRLHSIECALIAGVMAEELGRDGTVARRAALLHDIGKALTHKVEGSHAAVGAELSRRVGESEPVCHAIAAHHDEVEPQTVEAALVQAADAASAARPGARRQAWEQYVSRLNSIEDICQSFDGVREVHALQSGREVRVMVAPDAIDDTQARSLTSEITRKLEAEARYPGQINVTVIREFRVRGTAK